eukprot:Selendium_serpulae@DN4633_c1_g1_i1.p2
MMNLAMYSMPAKNYDVRSAEVDRLIQSITTMVGRFCSSATTTTTTGVPTTTVVPTTTLTRTLQNCDDEPIDVIFVLDSSASIEWKDSVNFITKMITYFDIKYKDYNVGAVQYSGAVHTIFDLNKYDESSKMISDICLTKPLTGKETLLWSMFGKA